MLLGFSLFNFSGSSFIFCQEKTEKEVEERKKVEMGGGG